MGKKIVVIGSSNTDMVIKTGRLPLPGETVLGGKFMTNPGGKGANQAVAAARLGGKVAFITKVGADSFGEQALERYRAEGIDTSHILCDPAAASGMAFITVDSCGENCIVVASGANGRLGCADIEKARPEIETADFMLMQLEIPLETVKYATEMAESMGVCVVLNPAPARELPPGLLRKTRILVPNRTEAGMISGVRINDRKSARKAAAAIRDMGVGNVVITLGSQGALVLEGERFHEIGACRVPVVDTTAAGDTFCGALCVALAEGMPLIDSARFASRAAAISVTRMGAQSSIPYRNELRTFAVKEKSLILT